MSISSQTPSAESCCHLLHSLYLKIAWGVNSSNSGMKVKCHGMPERVPLKLNLITFHIKFDITRIVRESDYSPAALLCMQ